MNLQSKTIQNSIISIIIIALWASIIIFLFYPSNSQLGNRFGVDVMLLLTRYFGLWSGIIVLFLRIIKLIKKRHSLIYILTGILNISLGVLGGFLLIYNFMATPIFNMFMLNAILGVIIFADVLLVDEQKS